MTQKDSSPTGSGVSTVMHTSQVYIPAQLRRGTAMEEDALVLCLVSTCVPVPVPGSVSLKKPISNGQIVHGQGLSSTEERKRIPKTFPKYHLPKHTHPLLMPRPLLKYHSNISGIPPTGARDKVSGYQEACRTTQTSQTEQLETKNG